MSSVEADITKVTKSAGKSARATKTLRDEFAMSALDHATSVYSKMTVAEMDRVMGRKNYSKDEAVARLAYRMADAMLAAREV
ncbi:hypothetical protein [uncultured Brevundimonas sp.]|uniref:hypothetical protein n=1 Tax=uncultured Brevundimonas sp. TaxID=213418 RepID=UPI00261CD4C8|nr:hypothetical protein [uncultured Brevundimonas sp.]